jgi:hypothetical protein
MISPNLQYLDAKAVQVVLSCDVLPTYHNPVVMSSIAFKKSCHPLRGSTIFIE